MNRQKNTPRRVASAPRGKGNEQHMPAKAYTVILAQLAKLCDESVTVAGSLAAIANDRPTGALAMGAYMLACDAHRLAEDFAMWEEVAA